MCGHRVKRNEHNEGGDPAGEQIIVPLRYVLGLGSYRQRGELSFIPGLEK